MTRTVFWVTLAPPGLWCPATVLRAILMEVTAEAVAVRHGQAAHVTAGLSPGLPGELELVMASESASNNTARRGATGLGERMLDDGTLGCSERSTDVGIELTAIFPIAEQPESEGLGEVRGMELTSGWSVPRRARATGLADRNGVSRGGNLAADIRRWRHHPPAVTLELREK